MPEGVPEELVLARLKAETCTARHDLVGSGNRDGGSGGQFGYFLEFDREFFKTALDRRYESAELALECERDEELLRQRLGIYHPERVWFLARGADGGFWACSITPIVRSLRERFNAGQHGPDRVSWELYLDAFRMTFELARRESVLLDCNPNNFGWDERRLYYLDDDLAHGSARMPLGHQALLRLREYEHGELSFRVEFLKRFSLLAEEYLADEHLRVILLEDLEPRTTWPREPELRTLLEDLVDSLARPRNLR